jgi:hypothetical protein
MNYEAKRTEIQKSLDSSQTLETRKMLGQFATPKNLADGIARVALTLLKSDNIRFLEPAIGTGVFYSSLLEHVREKNLSYSCGYEIDTHYAMPSEKLWRNTGLNYKNEDFLTAKLPKNESDKFNLIISNPPYVRHHLIEKNYKTVLNKSLEDYFQTHFSGLTGSYCYFMALAAKWLQSAGISAWLVPNEFLDVNYGVKMKEFLLDKVKLLRVHRYSPETSQFSDAFVTSIIVFYTTGKTAGTIEFTAGENIEEPSFQRMVCRSRVSPQDKWSSYFRLNTQKTNTQKHLGDFFTVKRGVSTGANKYFILDEEKIKDIELPRTFLSPILPGPRYIKNNIIKQDNNGIIGVKKLYLLDVNCPENKVKELPASLVNYMRKVYDEVQDNYTIKNRHPWYKQERRSRCPLLLTYMGRDVNKIFRLFLNYTTAAVPNVYLMIYPKFDWERIETVHKDFILSLYNSLLNIKKDDFAACGRVYGGGLYKIEPKELMNIPVDGCFTKTQLQIMTNSMVAEDGQGRLFV